MQDSSYLGKTVLVSMWLRMVLIHMITRAYKDSLTLTYGWTTPYYLFKKKKSRFGCRLSLEVVKVMTLRFFAEFKVATFR